MGGLGRFDVFRVVGAILAAAAFLFAPASQAQEDPPKGLPAEEAAKLQKVVQKLRGLKFKHPVTIGVQDKDTLRKKLLADFEKEFPREKALKFQKALEKFGLMKPGGDLWQTVVDLLSEQIAGFYDPETKELYLIADHLSGKGEDEGAGDPTADMMTQLMGVDQDRLVTVHELTHALQDQNFDLLTLPMGLEDNDDLVTGVKAVVEGEATFVMIEDVTRKMGMGLETIPGIDQLLEMGGAMPSGPGTESLDQAPEYLKRGLVFPYIGGLKFVQAVKRARGWEGVNGLYQDMPASTEQILHPEKYLDQRDQPTTVTLPDLSGSLGNGWEPLVTNVWGELNVDVIFKEFYPDSKTSAVSRGWDGDQFRVLENRKDHGLLAVWFSAWDSEKDAEQFTTAYKKLLGRKYGFEVPAEKQTRYAWKHDGSEISLERRGSEVLVVESCPGKLLAGLEESVWSGTGRKELARVERVARPAGDVATTAHKGPAPDAGGDGPKAARGGTDSTASGDPKAARPKSSGKRNPKPASVAGDGWKVETTLQFDCCTFSTKGSVGESSCADCTSVFRVTSFHADEGATLADAQTAARERLGVAMDGMKIVSQKPVKVDGRVGVRLVIRGTPKEVGQELTMDLMIAQGKDRFFAFVDAATSTDYEICKDAFGEWVKSAKITE